MIKVQVSITLKPGVHDPQAEAVSSALHDMGFSQLKNLVMGKHMILEIDSHNEEEALSQAETMCKELLANTVLERFVLQVIS
ncbi:MAG: phosphoribosylformylglycinamidine synthase subunit PurS [Alphaproteobacteria bacterium]|jgi:phosphoribosylformylglycinamidine synthase|nr:phosphoribosylformylglycinamidine synthase subunit PurS [Alphaproteobacteria bacterium]